MEITSSLLLDLRLRELMLFFLVSFYTGDDQDVLPLRRSKLQSIRVLLA